MSVGTTGDRRKGVVFWLVGAYLVTVGGFAGWRGEEFGTWPDVSLVVLPPAVAALALALRSWWRNPRLVPMILGLVLLPLVAAVTIGGMGLIFAWTVAGWTGRWSEPAVRAAVGVVLAASGFGLMWAFYRPRRAAGPPEASSPEDTGGAA